jgi:hypothetical protein
MKSKGKYQSRCLALFFLYLKSHGAAPRGRNMRARCNAPGSHVGSCQAPTERNTDWYCAPLGLG